MINKFFEGMLKKRVKIVPLYVAIIVIAGVILPAAYFGRAQAGQITSRSIQMSKSAKSATAVDYKVSFTTPTASNYTIKGIVVDFCSNSPLIGTTCTAPSGFSVGATITGQTGITGTWTVSSLNTGRTLTLVYATGTAINGAVAISFTAQNVTNSSTSATFYARILTYSDNTIVSSYTATAPGAYIDGGGVALSTTDNLTISARVQEALTFCVYTTGGSASTCGTGSALSIPADISGEPQPLSSSSVSTNNAYYTMGSNAISGVSIRLYSSVNNGLLTSGSNTIDAFGAGADGSCTADSSNSSTEQFGMRISGTTSIAAQTPYNCSAGQHGWDTTTSNDVPTVGTAYGDIVAKTTGPSDKEQNTMEFAAKSGIATEAGLYTTILDFIATGTY